MWTEVQHDWGQTVTVGTLDWWQFQVGNNFKQTYKLCRVFSLKVVIVSEDVSHRDVISNCWRSNTERRFANIELRFRNKNVFGNRWSGDVKKINLTRLTILILYRVCLMWIWHKLLCSQMNSFPHWVSLTVALMLTCPTPSVATLLIIPSD